MNDPFDAICANGVTLAQKADEARQAGEDTNKPNPNWVEPSTRLLNESAIREHALACSAKFRAGKFTRVGQDFIDEVQADVEAFVREIRLKWPTRVHEPLPVKSGLVVGRLSDIVRTALNDAIGRLIQSKVQRQPTVGKTLGRTR